MWKKSLTDSFLLKGRIYIFASTHEPRRRPIFNFSAHSLYMFLHHINILSSCNVCVQTLTWNITEELFTEVPLCLTFVSIKVLIGPPRLLVTEKHEREQLLWCSECSDWHVLITFILVMCEWFEPVDDLKLDCGFHCDGLGSDILRQSRGWDFLHVLECLISAALTESTTEANVPQSLSKTWKITRIFCRVEQVKFKTFWRPFWTKFETYTKYKKVRKSAFPDLLSGLWYF